MSIFPTGKYKLLFDTENAAPPPKGEVLVVVGYRFSRKPFGLYVKLERVETMAAEKTDAAAVYKGDEV